MNTQRVIHTFKKIMMVSALAATASSCSVMRPQGTFSPAQLTPLTPSALDIARMPAPKSRIPVAVYSFRDQTGQYKQAPDSSFSTAVTQGAVSILTKALRDSGWFIPVERESLQDILTERKIIRAIEQPAGDKSVPEKSVALPALLPANYIIAGSIVGYDNNVKTGGIGAKYFGISLSEQFRVDQLTLNLRVIDVNNGQDVLSVSTSKTIFSMLLDGGFYRFVTFRKLLQAEVGISQTEPTEICLEEAIRAGIAHLIAQGVESKLWTLSNESELQAPILKEYQQRYQRSISGDLPPKPLPPYAQVNRTPALVAIVQQEANRQAAKE